MTLRHSVTFTKTITITQLFLAITHRVLQRRRSDGTSDLEGRHDADQEHFVAGEGKLSHQPHRGAQRQT